MTKKNKFLLLFIFFIGSLWAQQVPMMGNAHIIEYRQKIVKDGVPSATRTQSTSTALILPFYDEFSNAGPYPDESKWHNSQSVYVNRTKAIAPPTLGIATFDGLNKYGYPYNDNQSIACGNYGNSLGNYPSDTLTSVDIRLDSVPNIQSLSPVDSIYLSFYYQAQGYFEAPETNDGLILEFYSPNDSLWDFIWGRSGYVLTDSAWNLVMIPIKDTSYFKKDFKFRFRNLSSASGDVDHWHIDVVYIDKTRNYKDTIFGDFTFSYDLPSPLKNYTQMPYNQYTGASDMKTNISGVAMRNNYKDVNYQNVGTYYKLYNKNGNLIDSVSNGRMNLDYYGTIGFCNNPSIVNPTLNYSYPTLSQPDTFLMKFNLDQPSQKPWLFVNDTIEFRQYFSNYFAYDDGSAEAGFGICNDTVVVKYTLNKADTLRAMDIFFDPIYDVKYLETTSFKLTVWADNGGKPANNPMYTDAVDRYPYFPADTVVPGTQRVNSFLRYQFQQSVALTAGTTFYIGVIPNSYNPLAIGFDRNTNYYQNMFRHTAGAWYVFPAAAIPDYKGSLMIRPVFGDSSSTVSVKDYQVKNNELKIYPNPANNTIQVSINNEQISEIKIYNMLGSEVQSLKSNAQSNAKKIDVSTLQDGVYLLKVLSDKGYISSQKLMISK